MCLSLYCRHVQGSHLLVCGPYVYNHYLDCKDVDYYLCSDKINDVLCLPPSSEPGPLSPILACQDCSLRLLKVSIIFTYLCFLLQLHP